jgi:hypothetical protein
MLKALNVLGAAKWPSLMLTLVVPVASYVSGWDSGAGVHRTPEAIIWAGDQPFRLWRSETRGGETLWCAEPMTAGPAPLQLGFRHEGGSTPGSFDAGQFCASLPASAARPQLATG